MQYLNRPISINLLILAMLLGLSSCKKEIVKVIHIRKIPDEMKAYWNFKPGSYWIYRDSVTGFIDSIFVTNYQNYKGKGILTSNDDTIIYEYLQINTHSSLDGYDYNYWINTLDAFVGQEDGNEVWSSKSNANTYVDTHPCFAYPLIIGNYRGLSYGGRQDSVLVKNLYTTQSNYSNVVEMTSSFNTFENGSLTNSFYAKNIGLVRYEVPEANKIRTLISYHINQ